ncbi:MAG: hypothetical protein HQL96_07315, partial [Magnetococcales bacterium]|nr:hypothetical protein [Magnetococcales bacterium]
SQEDYHLRFQVADPAFSEQQDRIHEQAMQTLKESLAGGDAWTVACGKLKVADAGFKEVILADFLKVLLAERHFQGGERLKQIASDLRVPLNHLVTLKETMIREVAESTQLAYRLSQSQPAEN